MTDQIRSQAEQELIERLQYWQREVIGFNLQERQTIIGLFHAAADALAARDLGSMDDRLDRLVRVFIGWLSVEIPELHQVEVSRLADSWERFKKTPLLVQEPKEAE